MALAISVYLPSFPYSPSATFRLLQKLDLFFASLLKGHNVETGEELPGCEFGKEMMTTTQKVRLRGLVERTRVVVVKVAGAKPMVEASTSHLSSTESIQALTTEESDAGSADFIDESGGSWEMDVARVYENTLTSLGASLDMSEKGFPFDTHSFNR